MFSETIFWSFCSLICKELAIIYSFLIGSNNSWSFVLCKNLTTLRILTNVTNVTPDEVFFCSRSRHVLTKFFSQKINFNLFRRFWPLLPFKVHFTIFVSFWTPFCASRQRFLRFESKNWRFLSFEINCEILIILSSILSFRF